MQIVAINYRSDDLAAKETLSLLKKGKHILLKGDVSYEGTPKTLVNDFIKKYNTLDVLINNAGVAIFHEIDKVSFEDWKGVESGEFGDSYILGTDISGIVEKIGKQVTKFRKGDAIIGSLDWNKQGAYSEFVASEEKFLTSKPENLTFQEAAGILGLIGFLTMLCALRFISLFEA